MAFKEMWSNFALFGLFVFAMFSFIVLFENNNNISDPLVSNTIFNNTYNNLRGNLSSFEEETERQKEIFENTNPVIAFGALIIDTIVSSAKIFLGMISGIFGILVILPATFLSIDPIIIGLIESILIVAIVLVAWKLYRVGE